MLKTRIISGSVLLVGIVVLIIIGGLPLWIASLVVACLAIYELYKVAGIQNKKVTWVSYPLTVIYFLLSARIVRASAVVMGIMVLLLTVYVILFPRIRSKKKGIVPFGFFYAGLLSASLYLTRISDKGLYWSLFILVSSWGSDSFAYCVGMLAGKRHPFPELSPKKTVEGCIGGIVGGAVLSIALALIMKESVVTAVITGTFASVFAEIGDLCASAFKRLFIVKDYGSIIPGHGGILDRFDSMMFTGAIVLICVTFLY